MEGVGIFQEGSFIFYFEFFAYVYFLYFCMCLLENCVLTLYILYITFLLSFFFSLSLKNCILGSENSQFHPPVVSLCYVLVAVAGTNISPQKPNCSDHSNNKKQRRIVD